MTKTEQSRVLAWRLPTIAPGHVRGQEQYGASTGQIHARLDRYTIEAHCFAWKVGFAQMRGAQRVAAAVGHLSCT
jgi:hypothetical protein